MAPLWKRSMVVWLIVALSVSIVACSTANTSNTGNEAENEQEPPKQTADQPEEPSYIEIWGNTLGGLPLTEDSQLSKMYAEETGVGVIAPALPWDGGTSYLQRLTTKIASGELPDMFLPWGGNELELIQQGVIADLTDYLPEYAPSVWNKIPDNVWDVVRTADPEGKGRIFYVPFVQLFNDYGAFIRQDWLDNVGMDVPGTQEELVEVLRAFRDQDANGNGDPSDELPISGREQGRWMDYLFSIYGVAMWEGFPMWDIYDGELTYSAVTPNMKDAIIFARSLYEEKLLDNETFLNKAADWMAKITSDKVGVWYHLNNGASTRILAINEVNPDVNLVALPIVEVDGYEGFITQPGLNRPQWMIADKSEETTINALKLIEFVSNPGDNLNAIIGGVEGMHYEVQDGKAVVSPVDYEKQELKILWNIAQTVEEVEKSNQITMNGAPTEQHFAYEQRDLIMQENQKDAKLIAGDGMPANVYDNYPDIKAHTLYQEYMTKIIIGEWPIEKFDEFVEKWYDLGGTEVTDRARAWYEQVQGSN